MSAAAAAQTQAQTEEDKVILISEEGQELVISRKVANQSTLVATMLSDDSESSWGYLLEGWHVTGSEGMGFGGGPLGVMKPHNFPCPKIPTSLFFPSS